MKTTKGEAKIIYDRFHGVLRCHNGGTVDENKRNARHCYERLKPWAELAEKSAKDPNKRLREDGFYLEALESLPDRLKAFYEQYKTEIVLTNQ